MKLWVCGLVLTIIVLAAADGKAEALSAQVLANSLSATHSGYADNCVAIPALMVTREIPEPSSVLLLAAGLISLALFMTIGRPPFRLKF